MQEKRTSSDDGSQGKRTALNEDARTSGDVSRVSLEGLLAVQLLEHLLEFLVLEFVLETGREYEMRRLQ